MMRHAKVYDHRQTAGADFYVLRDIPPTKEQRTDREDVVQVPQMRKDGVSNGRAKI
jgi:hypothetical protein